jgi:predicted MFS family arabinose efflux permease
MSPTPVLDEFRRAWKSLAASAVGIGFGLTGVTYYSFGVFVVPLMGAFGWSRGEATRASSFLIIGTAITAPIIGTIIDHFGARKVALISVFGVILGYLALSQQSGAIALFYATWFLMSLAGGGTTPVVFTRAVNMWFDKGRGLALGLALAGSGVSGIFGPSICTALIRDYGWQGGYVGLAVLTLVVAFPLLFLYFRERPLHGAATAATKVVVPGMTVGEAVRTVDFWKIAGGFVMISGTVAALMINLVPLLRDRGTSAEGAAALAGVMGIAVVIGRIGVGYLVDRFRAPVVARVLISLTAVGALLLNWTGAPWWVPALSAASFGLAAATEVDLVAFLTSRYFGMKAYGKIYGWQITTFYIGAATGPLAAGMAYDTLKGYTEVLYVAAALLVTGALVVGSLGRPPDFGAMPEH